MKAFQSFPLRKNASEKPFLDRAILLIRDYGIIDRLYQKYYGAMKRDQEQCYRNQQLAAPISLPAFNGVNLIFTLGFVPAFVALGVEKIVSRKKAKE